MGGGTKLFSLMLAMLIGTAGCAKGVPSDFYVLHAATSDSLVGAERGVAVGVGPVEVPAYLNRSQIVTRATDYELYLSESHQWAEPLKENISRVIAINLSNMLESNRVFVIPRRQKVTLDFQVAVDIARFDGQLGSLDYAFASPGLRAAVTGATVWHINADEPDILDYDTTFKRPAQDALYVPNAYRSSDHDPLIVGLAICDEVAPTLEVSVPTSPARTN